MTAAYFGTFYHHKASNSSRLWATTYVRLVLPPLLCILRKRQIEDILISTVGFTFSFYAVQTHELLHSDRTLVQKTRQALELLVLRPSCDRMTSEFPNWVQILGPIRSLKAVLTL